MNLKIAVVGTGSIGKRHLHNLIHIDGLTVCAVSEHNKLDRLEVSGQEIELVYSYEEALAKVDAVVICNPSQFHLKYLELALSCNKHVFMEKPAGCSAGGLRKLQKIAEDRGLVVAVGMQFRFNEHLQKLKQLLDTESLGDLLSVHASSGENIADYHPYEDYRTSYAARKELGGGVLLTQIHQVDYLVWLFGEVESVWATEQKIDQLQIDVESSVSYLLRTSLGLGITAHLNYYQRPKSTYIEIIGTKATVKWDYHANAMVISENKNNASSEILTSNQERNAMFVDCMANFLECIGTGGQPQTSLKEGVDVLEAVDGIKKSILNNKQVEL